MVADVPRQLSLRRFPGSNVLSYYVIIIFIYNYRVTSICIDLSKIKLFVHTHTAEIVMLLHNHTHLLDIHTSSQHNVISDRVDRKGGGS